MTRARWMSLTLESSATAPNSDSRRLAWRAFPQVSALLTVGLYGHPVDLPFCVGGCATIAGGMPQRVQYSASQKPANRRLPAATRCRHCHPTGRAPWSQPQQRGARIPRRDAACA
jgi:hypothetical protein